MDEKVRKRLRLHTPGLIFRALDLVPVLDVFQNVALAAVDLGGARGRPVAGQGGTTA